MIFRTFETTLDGSINKMGIFKRSFADISNAVSVGGIRGGFNSMAIGITQQDIANINEYNRLVGIEGVSSQTAWNRTMLTSSSTAQGLFDNQENLVRSGHGLVLSQEAISNATQKMTVKMKLAEVGMKALSVAGNMLLFMGISMAISGLIKGIDYLIHREEKLQEALDESISTLESTTSEIKSLEEQVKTCAEKIAELQKLKDAGTISLADEEELNNLKEENEELERQIALLQDKQIREGKQVLKDAKKQEDDKVQSRYKLGHKVTPSQELHGAVQAFIYAQNTDNDALADEHGARVEDMYEKIQPTLEAYRSLEEAGYDLSDAEEEHYAQLKKAEDEYLLYTHLLNGTKESFVALSEEMQKQVLIRDLFYKKGMTQEQATAVVENIKPEDYVKMWESDFEFTPPDPNDYDSAEEYGKAYADAWIKGAQEGIEKNANKMTVSIGDLEKASDNIKTLGSAFKELSEDGYITTKTLGEIQTATDLSGNEWEDYQTKLMRAKVGSSEFNQVMSDLTYKILDQTFANKDLSELTEQQIAATLRENGVVNANAVAHEYLTQAKRKEEIQSILTSKATDKEISSLINTANSCGVAKNAYLELVAKEILFNNNELDVKDKVDKINKIAIAAGFAGAQVEYLNNKLSGKDKKTQSAELGIDVIDDKNRDNYDKLGWQYKYNGITYEKFADARAMAEMDKLVEGFSSINIVPNYSGAASSSGSDKKNSALDNYLKDAENRYKIHQDETKYIQELQYAYDNLTKEEKERLDITGKINEAYRDLADNRIKDLEHQIDLTKELKGENANVVAQLNEIQRVANEEANRLRSMGYDNNSNEIQSLQKTWWDAEKEKLDWRFNISKEWIEQRNTFGDWHLFKDSEVKAWERVIKWLKDEYPHAVDEIKEAEESLFEARKEQLDKITDFTSSYFDSHKTLLQSYFDVTNSIAEAQHEINKELEASKTMYEYLDEETRKLLFNQEDYYKLSEELYDLQYEADKLQRGYEQALNNATLDTIEEITSQYEMQYEMMMKKYEIAKAELDVAKKRQQLDNVLNERNVRMLIDGQWQWVANTQDVIDAQKEYADAKYEAQQARLQKQQTDSLNDLTAQQDELGTVINKFESGVIDLDTAVGKIKNMFNELPTAMAQAISQLSSAKGGNSYSSSSGGGSSLGGSYRNDPSVIADLNRQMDENSKAWHSATSQEEKERLHNTNKVIAGYLGLKDSDFDSSTGKWKKHADGTRHTPGGWTLMGEEPEMYITANGHLVPINQPTIGNIDSGGVVFNQEQMSNLRSMWDLSNIKTPDYSSLVNRTTQSNIGTSNIFNGDIVVNQPHDYNDFVRRLTQRVRQKTV